MNTLRGNSPVERKRKNVVQNCKALIKLMQVEDGREEIDSLLDEALDCLAKVMLRAKGAHDRAVKERQEYEKEMAKREAALIYGRSHAKKVSVREESPEKQKSKIQDLLSKMGEEDRRIIISRLTE